MAASIGLIEVRILIFKLQYLSYLLSDFGHVCDRLYDLIGACISASHAFILFFVSPWCINLIRVFLHDDSLH